MPDFFSDLARNMKGKKIDVSDSFADNVMSVIERRKEGGFKSMSMASRIIISLVVLVIYCSLGILLGVKGYNGMQPDDSSSSQEALVELMDSHYISTDLLHDPFFRNFVCR